MNPGQRWQLREIFKALTCYNYFPNQKKTIGEIPPSIDTRQFTPVVAEQIASRREAKERKQKGYDLVSYRATRYNNIPRILSLVHPAAYSRFTKFLHESWSEFSYITNNKNSIAKPEMHEDGRIMIMNYGDPVQDRLNYFSKSFGKRFVVVTDISNCFGSIYTHSIPWAAVGLEKAKQNRCNGDWYNQLDALQRKCKRNETHGIPIGPATSNIVIEIILSEVDKSLSKMGFEFERYIDDYRAFCNTNEAAHSFVNELNKLLLNYKLTLNLRKTRVIELPSPGEEDWILELLSNIPFRQKDETGAFEPFSTSQAINLINQAIKINQKTPDGSVLKYAMQIITSGLSDSVACNLLPLVLDLSWHYASLTPYIDVILEASGIDPEYYQNQLEEIISHNAKLHRSDGICWPLHAVLKNELKLNEKLAKQIIDSQDSVAISVLFQIDKNNKDLEETRRQIEKSDIYNKDNHWLFLYQSYLFGKAQNPYQDETFEIMKHYGVNFFPRDGKSASEKEEEKVLTAIIGEIFSSAE